MSLTKDGFYKSFSGAIGNNNYLLEAGGGHIGWGNAANQIPYSNGTVNTNLNADMTDGLHVHGGRNNEANKIVRTDGSGYIQAGYINTNVGTEDSLSWSRVFFEYNNDGYIRKASISRAKTVFFGGQVGSPSVPIYWTGSAFATCIVSFGNSSYGEHDANNINDNGIKYYTSNGPSTSLGATTDDGALYSQAYSTSWVAQIAQDYRNGRLFIRGKNNGTWQGWNRVDDSGYLYRIHYDGSSDWASYKYHRVAYINYPGTYADRWMRLSVSSGETGGRIGELYVRYRTGGNGLYESIDCNWLIRNSEIPLAAFKVLYTNESSRSKAELWVEIPGQWSGYTFRVIDSGTTRSGNLNLTGLGWVLDNSNTGHGSSSLPSSTGIIDSYDGTKGGMYWANLAVQTTASTGTSPTFSTCYTSNWFRSTGATGWYSESYGGGIRMTDSSWIRTYGSKNFYVEGGNFAVSGNAGIGTTSPAHKLDVYGSSMIIGNGSSEAHIYARTSNFSNPALSFYDDTSGYGTMAVLGGGSSTVIGGGESAHVFAPNVRDENLYLTADVNVNIFTNLDGGYGSRKHVAQFTNTGNTYLYGNLYLGANASNNFIAFYGTSGDAPGSYVTSFIGEHLWGSTEASELLLMKFNDGGNNVSGTTVSGAGPDRIRHLAHAHVFQIMTSTSQDNFETMANSTAYETKLEICRNCINSFTSIILKGSTTADMSYSGNVHPYIRFDNSDSSQNVSFIFTDYDSYRYPAGIKLIGNQGGEWFEAPHIYSQFHHISHNSDDAVLLAGGGYKAISDFWTGKRYWANIEISTSSNTGTNPTFGTTTHNGEIQANAGIKWAPGTNIRLPQSGNGQEWSFDITRNGYTGGYWHVWDSAYGSLLTVYPDNGNVLANRYLGVGGTNLSYTFYVNGSADFSNRLLIDTTGRIYPYSTSTRRAGMYGNYDSYKIAHIWSIGTSYMIPDDGSTFGNLYGLAYKYTNNSTGGTMAGGHQAVWCDNGNPRAAMGYDGFWTKGAFRVQMDTNSSNAKDGLQWTNTSNTVIGSIQYHNVAQRVIINSIGSSSTWDDTFGKSSLRIGKEELTFNGFVVPHTYPLNVYNGSGANNYWRKLGTFTTAGNTHNMIIDIFSGSGYNGNANQNVWCRIMIKDGWQSSPSVNNCLGITVEQFGYPTFSYKNQNDTEWQPNRIQVRVNVTSRPSNSQATGELWILCPWDYANGNYTVSGHFAKWTHNGAAADTSSSNGNQTSFPTHNQQPVQYMFNVSHMELGTDNLTGWGGSFFFGGNATLFSGEDYVGLQAGNNYDKWQLVAGKSNLQWRQNDNGNTNTSFGSWRIILDSGNYTSYINNYYWANIHVSTSSNTSTNPQFNSVNVGGTSTGYGAYLASGKRLYIEGTEANAIYTEHHANSHISTNSPESNAAIRHGFVFKWYDTYWKIGNVRGGSSNSAGFGIAYYGGSQLQLLVRPSSKTWIYYGIHTFTSSQNWTNNCEYGNSNINGISIKSTNGGMSPYIHFIQNNSKAWRFATYNEGSGYGYENNLILYHGYTSGSNTTLAEYIFRGQSYGSQGKCYVASCEGNEYNLVVLGVFVLYRSSATQNTSFYCAWSKGLITPVIVSGNRTDGWKGQQYDVDGGMIIRMDMRSGYQNYTTKTTINVVSAVGVICETFISGKKASGVVRWDAHVHHGAFGSFDIAVYSTQPSQYTNSSNYYQTSSSVSYGRYLSITARNLDGWSSNGGIGKIGWRGLMENAEGTVASFRVTCFGYLS